MYWNILNLGQLRRLTNADKCGVYQLICPDCNMKYIGQTGRPFHVRFQEHFRDYKYANNKPKFAQHLLDNMQPIGATENFMDLIHNTKKGKMLDTMEKFLHLQRNIN